MGSAKGQDVFVKKAGKVIVANNVLVILVVQSMVSARMEPVFAKLDSMEGIAPSQLVIFQTWDTNLSAMGMEHVREP